MLIVLLAFRNIVGAGLRTWLNVFVLSVAFLAIVWNQGFINGMAEQMMKEMVDTELGGGQYWHRAYDPYDPLTLEDARGSLPAPLADLVSAGKAAAVLIASGAIFPEGRLQTTLLKGIEPGQRIVNIPSASLEAGEGDPIPALIGARMARQTRLKVGDTVTIRWRDMHGTFDAADIRIVHIMNTNVPSVDSGQVWLPLARLREMLQAPGQATLLVLKKQTVSVASGDPRWVYRDLDYLLKEVREIIKNKSVGSSIFYLLLLGMALLAVFDGQVLAVFRRHKEIGTLMALGMPRGTVIGLFTLEGALHGVMAVLVGALYGIPLLVYSAHKGMAVPEIAGNMGVAVSSTLYPSYGLGLVVGTTLVVLAAVTVVSFLPTRRISKLKPTDVMRGKLA